MSLVLGRVPPPWQVSAWLGGGAPTLDALRGRVVLVHAFQMLCPGCVLHALPQLERVRATFDPAQLAVVGLHTVFEHHAAMGRVALEAFMHEYRIDFPVGIDAPGDGPLPRTFAAWGLRGTPTLVLLDAEGRVRLHRFGSIPDLDLGAAIAGAAVAAGARATGDAAVAPAGGCGDACPAPA